ncbi:MAG TPA: hypothetical protein VGJ95_03445 [Pseudonocardiaceae bacterium]|jgi:hypothetical protein
MVRIDHIAAIEEQSAAFTEAVIQPGALDRPARACPGWSGHRRPGGASPRCSRRQ